MKKIASLIFVFLVSCLPQSGITESSTVIPPTKTPGPLTTARPANTLALSVTPAASRTPRPTATKRPTRTLDPTLATREAALNSCRGDDANNIDKVILLAYSSSGPWTVTICQDNGIYTKVENLSQQIVWNLPALDLDAHENMPGPEWYLEPYLWSSDGKYLYLVPQCLCFIDGPWLIYSSGFGLYRLSLVSGQVDAWLRPRSDYDGYSFAFTDNGSLFAFSPLEFPNVIKIRDLISGEERNLSFKEKYSILEYRWTPDNSRLVIFTEEHEINPSENGFSIFVYFLQSETLRKLLDKNSLNSTFPTEQFVEPRIYISQLSNDVLTLEDMFQENVFQFNIRNGQLTILGNEGGMPTITPTP